MALTTTGSSSMSVLDFAQFKAQAQNSLFANTNGDSASSDLFGGLPNTASNLFDQYISKASAAASDKLGATNNVSASSSSPFNAGGQNATTFLNYADVSFKAQFSELSEMKSRIAQQQDSAASLASISASTADQDILAKVRDFITTYDAGVNRFAPSVAQDGVLAGSAEAARSRFSLMRDINNPLIGAQAGIRDGLSSLGIAVDSSTGIATFDETALTTALSQHRSATVQTLTDFAASFSATTQSLNQAGNPQDKQLANLDKAIHWIDENRADITKEFGPGQAAKPSAAFAKAAAAYYVLMAKQDG